MDWVLEKMLRDGIPLTQSNYIGLAYFGEKTSIAELGPEEIAELPESFQDWPADEMWVN